MSCCAIEDCGNPTCRVCQLGRQDEAPQRCQTDSCLLVRDHRGPHRKKERKEK